jgi:hypothetical protein
MSSSDRDDSSMNLFKVMDGIIYQLNATKKLFIIMILTVMILPPVALFISSLIIAPPFEMVDNHAPQRSGLGIRFFELRILPLVISIVWLGIGIRQWFVLSKWTKRYETYKKLQRQIDEKLGGANDDL